MQSVKNVFFFFSILYYLYKLFNLYKVGDLDPGLQSPHVKIDLNLEDRDLRFHMKDDFQRWN